MPRRFVFFFFFQAEDGIRDLIVTGVQTCALPISPEEDPTWVRGRDDRCARRSGIRHTVHRERDRSRLLRLDHPKRGTRPGWACASAKGTRTPTWKRC